MLIHKIIILTVITFFFGCKNVSSEELPILSPESKIVNDSLVSAPDTAIIWKLTSISGNQCSFCNDFTFSSYFDWTSDTSLTGTLQLNFDNTFRFKSNCKTFKTDEVTGERSIGYFDLYGSGVYLKRKYERRLSLHGMQSDPSIWFDIDNETSDTLQLSGFFKYNYSHDHKGLFYEEGYIDMTFTR